MSAAAKFIPFLIISLLISASSQLFAQDTFTFSFQNESLDNVLIVFSEETGIDLVFNPSITAGKSITISYNGNTPLIFLKDLLAIHELRPQRLKNGLFAIRGAISSPPSLSLEEFNTRSVQITLVVQPDDLRPKVSPGQITSNQSGRYTVQIPANTTSLLVSMPGHQPNFLFSPAQKQVHHIHLKQNPEPMCDRLMRQIQAVN